MTSKITLSQLDSATLLDATTSFSPPLGAGATLFGDVIYVGGFSHLVGFVYSDVGSAVNGLKIEQGMQQSDFPANAPATTDVTHDLFTYVGGNIATNKYSVNLVAPFARIVYINGAAPQTDFRAFFRAQPF